MPSALSRLGLPESASIGDLRQVYYQRARLAHPDHGGTAGDFSILVRLIDEAREEIRMRKCPECLGTGRKLIGLITIDCPICRA